MSPISFIFVCCQKVIGCSSFRVGVGCTHPQNRCQVKLSAPSLRFMSITSSSAVIKPRFSLFLTHRRWTQDFLAIAGQARARHPFGRSTDRFLGAQGMTGPSLPFPSASLGAKCEVWLFAGTLYRASCVEF